jgi:hypothetical protein
MITRIQDDFSSNRLTSFALARRAGRMHGPPSDVPILELKDVGPFLAAAASTLAKEARAEYS